MNAEKNPPRPRRDKRLMPCPWCGKQPVLTHCGNYAVMCDDDKYPVAPETADGFKTAKEAIAAWNARG